MKQWKKKAAVLFLIPCLLSGCSGVTKEAAASRENGIALLEAGDYEGAIGEFESIIEQTGKVTAFELDVLKYRAEAEYGLKDYSAAAHTYDILSQIDEKSAEYCYLGALSLAKAGALTEAFARLEEGKALDAALEKPGYGEAMAALGEAYLAAGDKETADGIYEELIASGKADTEIYNRLMTAEMKQGNYEEALRLSGLGQALSDEKALKELMFNEAVCYEYLGQYEKALSLFQAYIETYGSEERAEHEIAFLVTR